MRTTFICEVCDFSTDRPNHYTRHNNTNKHKRMIGIIKDDPENNKKNPTKQFACDCGKVYPFRASLFNHKKKCDGVPEKITTKETILNELIEKTIKKNKLSSELKELSSEIEELKEQLLKSV
jgi:hypothetical protein